MRYFQWMARRVCYSFAVAHLASLSGWVIALGGVFFASLLPQSSIASRDSWGFFAIALGAVTLAYYIAYGLLRVVGLRWEERRLQPLNDSYDKLQRGVELSREELTQALDALIHLPKSTAFGGGAFGALLLLAAWVRTSLIRESLPDTAILILGGTLALATHVFFSFAIGEQATAPLRREIRKRLSALGQTVTGQWSTSLESKFKFLLIILVLSLVLTSLLFIGLNGSTHGVKAYLVFLVGSVLSVGGILIFIHLFSVQKTLQEIRAATEDLAHGGRGDLFYGSIEKEFVELADHIVVAAKEVNAYRTRLEALVEEKDKELRRKYEELKESARRIQAADRMKSEFLANMSHELRTPLNAIIGFSEVLRDQSFGPLNEKQVKYIQNILSSGHHLLTLINDILDLSKVEAGKLELHLEEVALPPTLEEVQKLLKPLVQKKKLQLTLEKLAVGLSIRADRTRFKQIMYNLLSNAIKFTPEGKSISVSTRVLEEDGKSFAAITVADTGIGIPEDQFERIFEAFHQGDSTNARPFEGTGLGLTLTKKLVEMQGGRIWVESEVGQGSRFTFTMPLSEHQAVAKAAALARPESEVAPVQSPPMPEAREQEVTPQPEGPVVLVAENDDKACELLTILLTRQGYRVVTARDGEEAVAKARELLPWALLLDIDLPRKDGWDVLQELKRSELTREIPVVIVSVVDDVARGFSLGAYDYFIKPVRPEALFRSLRRCRGVHRDPPGYGSSVLIIDDDAHQREALAQILKQEGYRVSKALSGEEGIARIVRESPDLVLVDLMMPGTSGFEVIERIRDLPKAREIPFAVLAEGQASAQEKAHLNGQLRKVYQTVDGFQEKLLQDLRKLQAHFPPRGHLIDTETGLYNQKYFLRRVVEEVRRVQRYRRPFSLLVMTVDIPSDRGSMTLQEIGRLLKANLRDTDIVAHWSGTTFTMILPEAMQEEATKVGEKLKNIIEGQGSARGFSVSFEVCVCDGADGKLRALMSRLHALLEETPMVKAPVGAPA